MENTNRKAKVTPENLEEAVRLRAIWDAAENKPNQAVFGELFEIGSQSAVTLFLNGKTPLSLKAARGFARGLGCEIEDFSQRLAVLAHGIAASVRNLPNEVANISPALVGTHRIPLIDYIQAGLWTSVTDSFQPGDAEDWLLTDLELSGKAFALQIKGESMRPDFSPGDRVIIDPDVQPQAGDFVVAKNGNEEATFKKYRVRGSDQTGNAIFELVPLNEDFETMRSDMQPIRIVGVMVEHRKYRKNR